MWFQKTGQISLAWDAQAAADDCYCGLASAAWAYLAEKCLPM